MRVASTLPTAEQIKQLAHECGFELAGIVSAGPHPDYAGFDAWRRAGHAGEMQYLTDRRGDLRADPRNLLPDAKTMLCLGKLYNTPFPHTDADPEKGWISRYAWGDDYHESMRADMDELVRRIQALAGTSFTYRMCVDTAPLLERSYARSAGLGWIGKNTCLINQEQGSWFFLGEILLSLDLAVDEPAPDRCGTCTRCIDACPTAAIVAGSDGRWVVDARECISYLTIEKRGEFNEADKHKTGKHIFGCDICQDVCPWNRRAAVTDDRRFWPREWDRDLKTLAGMEVEQFKTLARRSPIKRSKFEGFLRNVLAALGCCLAFAFLARGAADSTQNAGMDAFYNLDYDGALRFFQAQLQKNPRDLSWYNNVAQTILYRQMYRDGQLSTSFVDSSNAFLFRPKLRFSKADKEEFNRDVDHVLSFADSAKDPRTLYAVGSAFGLRATYLFTEKDWIGALKAATAANKSEQQVLSLDPGFTDAKLIPAVYEYVTGSLPFYLRMLSFLGGFEGDVAGGIRDLETVRQKGVANRYDAEVLLAAIYRREHQPGKAAELLKDASTRFPHNPLLGSELAAVEKDKERKR